LAFITAILVAPTLSCSRHNGSSLGVFAEDAEIGVQTTTGLGFRFIQPAGEVCSPRIHRIADVDTAEVLCTKVEDRRVDVNLRFERSWPHLRWLGSQSEYALSNRKGLDRRGAVLVSTALDEKGLTLYCGEDDGHLYLEVHWDEAWMRTPPFTAEGHCRGDGHAPIPIRLSVSYATFDRVDTSPVPFELLTRPRPDDSP
jgi:hypothetical protein